MIGKLISFFTRDSAKTYEVLVTNANQHDAIYRLGSGLISPSMQLHGQEHKLTRKTRQQVATGIGYLDAVTAYNPLNWAAFWIKGKGYQAMGDHAAAHREFGASYRIEKNNADVAREYAASCLELGLAADAVEATRHAIQRSPQDAGLQANLALALLLAGNTAGAEAAIRRALEMSPKDQISMAVDKVIVDVIAGRRRPPNRLTALR